MINLRQRAYWHVDAKWICSLLLIISLAITVPAVALYRLTAKGSSTNLVAYTLAGLTSPQGIDSAEGLEDIRQEVVKAGSKTITIAGIDVVFTPEDVNTLSPRELRLKVFSAFAERYYDQGTRGFAESQGLSEEVIDKAERDSTVVGLFTKDMHQRLLKIVLLLALVSLLLLAGTVVFSYRFGRLVTPGLILTIVGLPALLLVAAASSSSEVSGSARPADAEGLTGMLSTFGSFVAPLLLPIFSSTYLAVFFSGLGLLLAAAIGRLVYKFKHAKHGEDKDAADHKPPAKE